MKSTSQLITIFLFLCTYSFGQNYVDFRENGLRSCCAPLPAQLKCPTDSIKAKNVLDQVIKLNMPKKHINGYCEVRAEYICRKIGSMLASENCKIGKIWVFSPSISTLVSNQTLSAENPLIPGDIIKWEYHVAPIFAIKNGTQIDTMVIDFSIADDSLINYHDWLKVFNCKKAIYTFTDSGYYLFNTLNGLLLDGKDYNNLLLPNNFPKIITGHFYYLQNDVENTIASGLAYNDLAIYLIEKYYDDPQYLKFKFQLKEALQLNNLTSINTGEYSKLPKEIVENAKSYFEKRFNHWSNEIKN